MASFLSAREGKAYYERLLTVCHFVTLLKNVCFKTKP